MKIKNTFSIVLIICGVGLAAMEVFFSVLAGQSSAHLDSAESLLRIGNSILCAVIIILATYAVAQFLNFMYIIAKSQSKADTEEEETKN